METRELAAVVQLELKYCERCGGLFLRRQEQEQERGQGLADVYCAKCAGQMAEGWASRKSRKHPRLPVNRDGYRLLQLVSGAGAKGGNL